MAEFFVDAHCHLTDPRLRPEVLDEMIARSRIAGVRAWIQGGVGPEDWDRQQDLARRYPGRIGVSFGLHPWWVTDQSDAHVEEGLLALEARVAECLAIGELGLDERKIAGFPAEEREAIRKRQLRAFGGQLQIARKRQKPLILHIVQAHGKALEILGNSGGPPEAGGIVHAFSGPEEIARRYVDLGLALSVSGVITRKGFESLKKAVVSVPGDSLVIETDAPDQPLEGDSGLNEPARLPRVADAVAALRGESREQVLKRSARNLRRIFGESLKWQDTDARDHD